MSLRGALVFASKGDAVRPLTGLRGVLVATSGNLSVKVINYKGRGISEVRITTIQGKTYFTDSQGNAFIQIEGSNVQLTLSKYKVKKVFTVPNGVAQIEFIFGRQALR